MFLWSGFGQIWVLLFHDNDAGTLAPDEVQLNVSSKFVIAGVPQPWYQSWLAR